MNHRDAHLSLVSQQDLNINIISSCKRHCVLQHHWCPTVHQRFLSVKTLKHVSPLKRTEEAPWMRGETSSRNSTQLSSYFTFGPNILTLCLLYGYLIYIFSSSSSINPIILHQLQIDTIPLLCFPFVMTP